MLVQELIIYCRFQKKDASIAMKQTRAWWTVKRMAVKHAICVVLQRPCAREARPAKYERCLHQLRCGNSASRLRVHWLFVSERSKQIFNLEHYLDVHLNKKPSTSSSAALLAQYAPWDYGRKLSTACGRYGRNAWVSMRAHAATVDLLLLASQYGWSALKAAAEKAIDLGCTDEKAVNTAGAAGPTCYPQ